MNMVKKEKSRARSLPHGGTVFLILALSVMAAFGQSNKGSVVGTVLDPNGAIVGGAKVVVTNNATKEAQEITAGDDGEFAVTNLEPGVYSVRVEAAGFKTLLFSTVTVRRTLAFRSIRNLPRLPEPAAMSLISQPKARPSSKAKRACAATLSPAEK